MWAMLVSNNPVSGRILCVTQRFIRILMQKQVSEEENMHHSNQQVFIRLSLTTVPFPSSLNRVQWDLQPIQGLIFYLFPSNASSQEGSALLRHPSLNLQGCGVQHYNFCDPHLLQSYWFLSSCSTLVM